MIWICRFGDIESRTVSKGCTKRVCRGCSAFYTNTYHSIPKVAQKIVTCIDQVMIRSSVSDKRDCILFVYWKVGQWLLLETDEKNIFCVSNLLFFIIWSCWYQFLGHGLETINPFCMLVNMILVKMKIEVRISRTSVYMVSLQCYHGITQSEGWEKRPSTNLLGAAWVKGDEYTK